MPPEPPVATEPHARSRAIPPAVLVTAGPTEEPIDAVRFIGNRSSGRMGIEIARAFADAGCRVTLLLGPARTEPPVDARIDVVRFRTAAELAAELGRAWPDHAVLIMSAAVADFRPAVPIEGKIVRGGSLTLELEPVPDLLASLPRRAGGLRVGFALEEPARLRERARTKMAAKDLDAVVANPLETMESGSIDATLFWRDGREERASPAAIAKRDFARWLAGRILEAAATAPARGKDTSCDSR